jgi:hypothetical protein
MVAEWYLLQVHFVLFIRSPEGLAAARLVLLHISKMQIATERKQINALSISFFTALIAVVFSYYHHVLCPESYLLSTGKACRMLVCILQCLFFVELLRSALMDAWNTVYFQQYIKNRLGFPCLKKFSNIDSKLAAVQFCRKH